MKDCQFCGDDMNETSYYCHNCNHLQRNKALAYERYFRIQILRFGALATVIVLPLTTFYYYMGRLEWSVAIMLNFGQFIMIGLFCFPLLSMVFSILPESSFGNTKMPYLLERIEYSRNVMIRNCVIFPVIACFLVFAQIKLAQTKPTMKDFRAYLKTEKAYSKKGILLEGECALLTYHLVANTEGFRCFVGLNNSFYSFDPSGFSEISK